jgi:glycerol-3-phosphate acyltransferase PlsY
VRLFLSVALGYLVGSIPFGFLVARRRRGVDIRRTGSGNVGATNVFRSAGVRAGLTTAVLDVAKGAGAVFAAWAATGTVDAGAIAGVAAVAGHAYPVWLGFRGGKGVATAFGAFTVLAPLPALVGLAIFGVVVRVTRYVSAGSVAAAVSLGPLVYLSAGPPAATRAAFVSGCLILFTHRSNLARLLAGSERRLGASV